MIKTKLKRYIIITILTLISGIVAYSLINIKKRKNLKSATVFFTENTAWADTTLNYLPLNEKISQLLIYDVGFINKENELKIISNLNKTLPGGIIYKTDSLINFIKYQNNFQKISKINLFTFQNLKNFCPNVKQLNIFPDVNTLMSVTNDSIKLDYLKLISSLNKKLNISINAFPEILKLKNDTTLINNFNKTFKEKNLIACMQEGNTFNNKLGLSIFNLKSNEINEDSILSLLNSGTELFISKNIDEITNKIKKLIDDEKFSEDDLNQIVRKVLLAKTWAGLNNNIRIEPDSIYSFINNKHNIAKINLVYNNSISLVKNINDLIPFKEIQNTSFAVITIGDKLIKFNETFGSFHSFKSVNYNSEKDINFNKLTKFKKIANIIIVANNSLIDSSLLNNILEVTNNNTIFVNFGQIENLVFTDKFNSVINVNSNSEIEQKYTAQSLFGGIGINGYITNTLNDSLKTKKVRVSKALPEEVDLNSEILTKIDSIAKNAIRRGAFPGCQIVVLKNGYDIYNKSFGYQTYSRRRRVKKTDLYDLASITKIAATTTAAMRMYDHGRLKLNSTLGRYFRDTKIDYSNIKADTIINIDTLLFTEVTDFKKILKFQDTLHISDTSFIAFDTLIVTATPKNNIFRVKIKDLLLHKSGISPTLPILPYVLYKKNFYDSIKVIEKQFYENLKNDTLKTDTIFDAKKELNKIYDNYFTHQYIKDSSETKIANGFYLQNRYFDTLWRDTKRLRVYSRKIYQYSDINMILLQQAIDSTNHRSINSYLRRNIYLPMGLKTMCYKPNRYFNIYNIVPTEDDKYWRTQLLRGNVHDPSAALLGGISGNAGLFSNAYDLAVLGQMWLNGGSYGGKRYISEKTIKKFTGFQEDSHRGLGFDKPTRKSIIGKGAPKESFGHTGFTGTCIWVDPVNDIVFVFLSNRVNPSAKNWRINTLKVRQKIHTVVYDAIEK